MHSAHRAVSFLMFLVLLSAFLLVAGVALAQKPIKTDVTLLFDKVPAPPAAFGCALQRPAELAALEKQIGQHMVAITTARTAGQSRDEAAMQAFGEQATADGVENMTDQQKMAYLQQQGSALPGHNAQALQLAQQMQDPAFQAKLAKMSDAEKAQFLQQQMAAPGSAQQRLTANPAYQAAQAEFMQQMRDPAFQKAWAKKSEAEQDAYTEQLMRKHGLNEASMKSVAGKTPAAPLGPLVTKAALEAYSTMSTALAASSQTPSALQRLTTALHSDMMALEQSQQAQRLPEAKDGDCAGQQRVYEQNRQFFKRRQDLMRQYLPRLTAAWTAHKAQLKARVAPFQKELAAIHYTDDIRREDEKANIAPLAGGQQQMLMEVQSLADFTAAVYDLNQQYCSLQQAYDQPFSCHLATCFPATAMVALPGGRQLPIEQIRAGDVVLGYDAAADAVVPTRVLRLDEHTEAAYLLVQLTIGAYAVYASVEPSLASGLPATELLLTPNHPLVLGNGQTRRADSLQTTDDLLQLQAATVAPTHLTDRQDAGTAPAVYNLRTESGNYFVSGILVGSK
ncbi:Hint domain-containing protein [Hymenobacter sp. J193]|uniref:Hint domain-containing protein n=1 Tax=Hymenobacter sp. J193 TaxID=2898429 RepID=UPI00215071A3|nr:Hint domain-containing protein [Hymenobacter sp. J193]MCR5886736.1 Hint domain-containing protein [Hymenobacter sp. J193]